MSAIDWEHAPEIAKPTYEELEAMCWELTEQNAELRELCKGIYEMARCFYVGTGSADDLQELRDRMGELGVDA